MSILVKTVRISGFRGLENIQVDLEKTTVLTGMNNAGKTSFLKAMQIALGNRQFISPDDFCIIGNNSCKQITIDLLIVPVNENGGESEDFTEEWEVLLTTHRIRTNGIKSFIPLRTICTIDPITSASKIQQFILPDWPNVNDKNNHWFQSNNNGQKTNFYFDETPFFYMDAQRDIMDDTKQRNSYLGKMVSNIEYSDKDIEEIEKQIKLLNEKAVSSSNVLSNIKDTLKDLDSAMGSQSSGVEITPFTKKIRDLNKGMSIYYGDTKSSLSMEYHGMGTRSWSSLLTLKSFINQLALQAEKKGTVFSPLLAIEEPEAHLHPNAQKKLFGQISTITGQKIISTHSPYIAATAELSQIRNFYKNEQLNCGRIKIDKLTAEDIRKIKRQVINSRGEIFFSKLIVFCEGETEEQSLPIFVQKYFGRSQIELGLDFVGVGGKENYLPFLRFAEDLNIPWFILSDAEENTVKKVSNQHKICNTTRALEDTVIFLDDGNNFERQLIDDGFQDEIKACIFDFIEYKTDQHEANQKHEDLKKINDYSDDDLISIMKNGKTKYGPAVAEKIVAGNKELPPKVNLLFDKIKSTLNLEENVV
jgi:putative ATP-dependent endonuclease of OLD family